MEFRILGPLEVRDRGHPLAVTAAKQRTLLGILLVHANQPVSTDLLIEEIWDGRPPKTAANALQVYVTGLRSTLEPERARRAPSQLLPARAGGYSLVVEPEALDADRFEREVETGKNARLGDDAAGAAEGLRRALDMWRGAALADFTYAPFAQAEIARLEELRLAALEERIEADLDLGRETTLTAELEGLVGSHPLRERLRGQLMVCFYRTGRQAEALEAYAEIHRTLVDELGIPPGPPLQELQRSILNQDPQLDRRDAGNEGHAAGAVGTPPVEVAPVPRESRKNVAVLVIERESATNADPVAQRSADEHELEATQSVIERHGGSVESVLGTRTMAVFGVPLAHEDDALRGMRAAAELMTRSPEGGPRPLAARVGLAAGEILAGGPVPISAEEPVRIAAELVETASPGEILVSGEVKPLLGGAGHCEPVEGRPRAWRLVELAGEPPPLTRPPDATIVGREAELVTLHRALERATAERAPQLVTVLGSPGIGKSRLVQELASRVGGEAIIAAGRCLPYGDGITFWPLREIVEQLTAEREFGEIAGQGETGRLTEAVAEALVKGDSSSSREDVFVGFRRLLESAAEQRPVVAVFEDVHWAEPTLLDLIEYLAERGGESPLLLLCLARLELLEERPTWAVGKQNVSSILLEELTQGEAEQMIAALEPGLDADTRRRALRAAEGNPLYLGQIVAMLSEGGLPAGEVPIPPTIQALLNARLDRLGPGERAVIDRAAVIGKEFWEAAVEQLLPEDARPFVHRHLATLLRRQLLMPARSLPGGGDGYRFHHILIQQAAYRAVPGALRADLHERFADWVEGHFSASEFPEIAGHHLERAHHYRREAGADLDAVARLATRASGHLALAGRRAFGRGDMPAAAALLGRSSSLLGRRDADAPQLYSDLGYSLFEVGKFAAAERALAEAERRAAEIGDRAVALSAKVKLSHVRLYTDPRAADLETLSEEVAEAIEALDRLGDNRGLSRAWFELSDVLYLKGRLLQAAEGTAQAAQHARLAGSKREEAMAIGLYGFCLFGGPATVNEAIASLTEILEDARGNQIIAASVQGFLALQEGLAGRNEPARQRVAESLRHTRDLGLSWLTGIHSVLSAYVDSLAGDHGGAERHLLTARQAFIEIGDHLFLSTVMVDLARAIYDQGRYDEAFALTADFDRWPAPADTEWQIKRRVVRALLLAREGGRDEASKVATEAVAVATGSEYTLLHGDGLLALADVHVLGGRSDEAIAAAREAEAIHRAKGNVVGEAAARERLEALR
jgi:DNA-binding SARP family transcriptional activator